jgi:ATP-binding protein involved in chromosome partitioning
MSKDQVLEALKKVEYPGFSRDVVSFGIVNNVEVDEKIIKVKYLIKSSDNSIQKDIEKGTVTALKAKFPKHLIEVKTEFQPPSTLNENQAKEKYLSNIKYKIAVASGKGGVGKSTVSVNLALSLAKAGLRVGLLDADIYGPSIPMMLGINEQPMYDGKKLHPIEKYGVQWMSIGMLVDNSEAVIWRGSLVHRAIQQLMSDVNWPELDVMLFDMPPGTGDAQLTLSQSVSLDGAIIVSTPQDVALLDAVKGVQMFRRVNVSIWGIIENMSYFSCPHCGERTDIFSTGGAKNECEKLDVPFLGDIPLKAAIRSGGDSGFPIVIDKPDSEESGSFQNIANAIKTHIK